MDEAAGTACLIIPNLPAGAFCGIDLLSFTTSPQFRGIRQLPRGWHVVFTGANNTFSSRHGSWFFVESNNKTAPELFVKEWDKENEELVPETDTAAILSWRANLGGIWREGLTPYRQTVPTDGREGSEELVEETADWETLTDTISEALLGRISGPTSIQNHWTLTSASSAKQDEDNIPGLSKEESTIRTEKELGFLPINLKQTWRPGAVGRERTIAAQDRSWALQNLIQNHCVEPLEVIGELQFCFLMVLTINNYSCLEQWRRLLGLLFTCREAVSEHPELFVKLLSVLKLQLKHCEDAEGGLFDLSDEGGSLLKSLLKKFREGLEQLSFVAKMDVLDELEDLEDYLKAEHGWLFNESAAQQGTLTLEDGETIWMDSRIEDEDESGDYLPLVVDLTEEQAERLGRPYNAALADSTHALIHATPTIVAHGHGEVETSDEDQEEEGMEPEDLDARY